MQPWQLYFKYQICGHVGILANDYIFIIDVLTFKFTIIQYY